MIVVVKMVVKVVKMVVKVVKICYTCFCTGSSSQLRSVKDTGQPHLLNALFGSNFPDIQNCAKKNRVMLPSCPAASTQLQDLLHGSIKFLSFLSANTTGSLPTRWFQHLHNLCPLHRSP